MHRSPFRQRRRRLTILQQMCTGAAVRTPRWSQRGKRRKLMPPPQRGVTKVREIAAFWRQKRKEAALSM